MDQVTYSKKGLEQGASWLPFEPLAEVKVLTAEIFQEATKT
jgi:hypothetical protein